MVRGLASQRILVGHTSAVLHTMRRANHALFRLVPRFGRYAVICLFLLSWIQIFITHIIFTVTNSFNVHRKRRVLRIYPISFFSL